MEDVKMWSARSETKRTRQIDNYPGRSEWLWSKEHFNVNQVKPPPQKGKKTSETDDGVNKKNNKNEQESVEIMVSMKMEDVERDTG